MAQNTLIQIGMLIVLIGIFVIFIGAFLSAEKDSKSNVKFSFFGLFGFIPFGFSNDRRLFFFSIGLTLLLVILFFFLYGKNVQS